MHGAHVLEKCRGGNFGVRHDVSRILHRPGQVDHRLSLLPFKDGADLRRSNGNSDPLLVLVGNKRDLESERKVKTCEGQSKARALRARFYETSAYQPGGHLDSNANCPDIEGILMQLALDLARKPEATPLEDVEKEPLQLLGKSPYDEKDAQPGRCCSS